MRLLCIEQSSRQQPSDLQVATCLLKHPWLYERTRNFGLTTTGGTGWYVMLALTVVLNDTEAIGETTGARRTDLRALKRRRAGNDHGCRVWRKGLDSRDQVLEPVRHRVRW
jgi:hypothetical protein